MSCKKRNVPLKSLLSMTAAGLALCCGGYDTNDLVTVRTQDTGEALINPGMGLVHYHYSNRLWAYGMYSKPGDTDPLPGTSVVYLRVLWSDLEPKEGEFHWDIFDSVAQNWIKAGKQLAFRVICCNQTVNATPDWVREAGGKGINISRALSAVGRKNCAIVAVGGENGDEPFPRTVDDAAACDAAGGAA